MASKTNTNKWSDVQLAIAAISMTSVIAFWNVFAGPDKAKADENTLAEQQSSSIPTITPTVIVETPMPQVTMPPVGYAILFGGAAPQPQVIVVNKPKGGGGGGDDGSASAPASEPVTSTSSS